MSSYPSCSVVGVENEQPHTGATGMRLLSRDFGEGARRNRTSHGLTRQRGGEARRDFSSSDAVGGEMDGCYQENGEGAAGSDQEGQDRECHLDDQARALIV